jgi:hypothetical protein
MEENKKCCEKGDCEKCNTCCGMPRCCSWHKCHMMKYLVWLVIIIVVFCLGAQYGEMKSSLKGPRYDGRMMNWNTDRFENKFNKDNMRVNDSVTVEVQEPTE